MSKSLAGWLLIVVGSVVCSGCSTEYGGEPSPFRGSYSGTRDVRETEGGAQNVTASVSEEGRLKGDVGEGSTRSTYSGTVGTYDGRYNLTYPDPSGASVRETGTFDITPEGFVGQGTFTLGGKSFTTEWTLSRTSFRR